MDKEEFHYFIEEAEQNFGRDGFCIGLFYRDDDNRGYIDGLAFLPPSEKAIKFLKNLRILPTLKEFYDVPNVTVISLEKILAEKGPLITEFIAHKIDNRENIFITAYV